MIAKYCNIAAVLFFAELREGKNLYSRQCMYSVLNMDV